jgi:hypothetical protein
MTTELLDSPIFVVGAPRSGTTLLQRMLRSHPRISSPTGESHFFIPLFTRADEFGDLREKENVRRVLQEMYRIRPDFLDTDLHGMKFDVDALTDAFHGAGVRTIPQLLSLLMETNARGEGKARWLDKTPYYVLHLPKIRRMFPSAQIVHIIRDGRDAVLSMMERRHDIRVYNTYHGAKLWQQYVEAGHNDGMALGPEAYLEIRYEDLITEPAETVRKVCGFLNEEFSESVIHFQKSSDPKTKTPLLKQDLQSSNREKWRGRMSPWQIRVFESAAGDTLKHFNYPTETDCRPLPLPYRGACRLHNQLWAAWFRAMMPRSSGD